MQLCGIDKRRNYICLSKNFSFIQLQEKDIEELTSRNANGMEIENIRNVFVDRISSDS
jgi:hypothetical protein